MATFSIRSRFSGKILHTIDIGDRHMDLYAPDLHGLDLANLILNGADLSWANLAGANLRGTKFREANLCHASLQNADASYCDFTSADLRDASLEGAILFPSEFSGAHLYGAIITHNTEIVLPTKPQPRSLVTEHILARAIASRHHIL